MSKQYMEEISSIDIEGIVPKVYGIGFSGGRVFLGVKNSGCQFQMINLRSGKPEKSLQWTDVSTSILRPIIGGNFLVCQHNYLIKLDSEGQEIDCLKFDGMYFNNMDVFQRNYALLSTQKKGVIVVDYNKRGEIKGTYEADSVSSMCCCPGWTFVTGHENGEIFLWELKGGKKTKIGEHEVKRWVNNNSRVTCVHYVGKGRIATSSYGNGITRTNAQFRIWDIKEKCLVKKMDMEDAGSIDSMFCFSSRYMITGHMDRQCRIWDLDSYRRISKLSTGFQDTTSMYVDKVDKYLFVAGVWQVVGIGRRGGGGKGGAGGKVRIYEVDSMLFEESQVEGVGGGDDDEEEECQLCMKLEKKIEERDREIERLRSEIQAEMEKKTDDDPF